MRRIAERPTKCENVKEHFFKIQAVGQKFSGVSFLCSVFKDAESLSAKVSSQLLLLPDRAAAAVQSAESERQREQQEEPRQRRDGSDPRYSPTRYAHNAGRRTDQPGVKTEWILHSVGADGLPRADHRFVIVQPQKV